MYIEEETMQDRDRKRSLLFPRIGSRGLIRAIALLVFMAGVAAAAIGQDQITRVGVVNLQRVTTAFFQRSRAVRELTERRADVLEEAAAIEEEIFALEQQRLRASELENRTAMLRLDQELQEQKEFLRSYLSIQGELLDRMAADLSESDTFLDELADAIEFVAESQGYSIILNNNHQGFLFWTPEVDVTDDVIEQLARSAR